MVKMAVIGSISTDFVVTSKRRPQAGETIFGENFETYFGGKGANQAVATRRLGAETYMLGAVGTDNFGANLIMNLENNQIDVSHIKTKQNLPSGSAIINVVEGENTIIYVAGANDAYSCEDVSKERAFLSSCDLILIQNESSPETVEFVFNNLANEQCKIIYNPAPAREFDSQFMAAIDYITPNEHEFQLMFPEQTMEEILSQYPNKMIVTLGSQGALFHNGHELVRVPSYTAEQIIDTTGAGDTFNGALAFAIGNHLELEEAIRFANLAAALSIGKEGAQNGMPTIKQMKESVYFEKTWNIK
ncbi:ribokinase [Facklamia miroungae]|uniref:Ribokinase n=1 Tax=Facklamia miroungae TaxID=120956 RepID=A0A1G7QBW3_9LACT|nr:ribokinase [Facklamia miroungae]NKZ28894.1 ribokinase [Facklamia miroungae]SDF96022.1 ribokinase [Facklamia miroungae]